MNFYKTKRNELNDKLRNTETMEQLLSLEGETLCHGFGFYSKRCQDRQIGNFRDGVDGKVQYLYVDDKKLGHSQIKNLYKYFEIR
mgnify:FL=1